jgi:hypothetical protein
MWPTFRQIMVRLNQEGYVEVSNYWGAHRPKITPPLPSEFCSRLASVPMRLHSSAEVL